ncbi:MAG: PAS domain-containing sensor histidine kinase, partial [Gammaproteobacteria bacterium]|nr:PAS domain-containing sensor histidine kinase [Gammaproteobacteria bacterium]
DKYRQLDNTEDEQTLLHSMDTKLDKVNQLLADYRPEITKTGVSDRMMAELSVYDEYFFNALDKLKNFWIIDFESVEAEMEDALTDSRMITKLGLYSLPFFTCVSVFMIWILYRSYSYLNIVNRKMHKSEEFIAEIINSNADAIIAINHRGEIQLFNPEAERMFGYKQDEVLGQDVSIIVPENERMDHKRYVAESKLYSSRIIHNVRDLYGMRKDGSIFAMELNVSRMKHRDQAHFIGVCRDITERKGIEKNKERIQRATEQALRDAEKASQAKSQFLASMSHELRTPLNSIIGFSQLSLLEHNDNENLTNGQKKNISEIEKAGYHLLTLINQVLDMSKIESGQLDFQLEPVNIVEMLTQCEQLIYPLLDRYSVSYKSDYENCKEIVIQTDHTRLKQILLNLLTNACKYNKAGGLVETKCELLSGFVRISVIDTGIGINHSELSELFEPFNRLGAECGSVEGTGIGLNITLKLVELLGGNLGVESEPAKGSHFWVDLPLEYQS